MKIIFLFLALCVYTSVISQNNTIESKISNNNSLRVNLPNPLLKGSMTLEEALSKRRSVREYQEVPLMLKEVSQILWSAYGITDTVKRKGVDLKTAPSAMALYPLSIYVVVGNVSDLLSGIYCYYPKGHYLLQLKSGDYRNELSAASNNQNMIKNASFVLVYSYDTLKLNSKFGKEAAIKLSSMDLGHSAENVYLQATALGLGTCAIGGLKPASVSELISMLVNEKPIYIMPVGKLKDE